MRVGDETTQSANTNPASWSAQREGQKVVALRAAFDLRMQPVRGRCKVVLLFCSIILSQLQCVPIPRHVSTGDSFSTKSLA